MLRVGDGNTNSGSSADSFVLSSSVGDTDVAEVSRLTLHKGNKAVGRCTTWCRGALLAEEEYLTKPLAVFQWTVRTTFIDTHDSEQSLIASYKAM